MFPLSGTEGAKSRFCFQVDERRVASVIPEVQDMYCKQCTFSHCEIYMNREFISLPHVRAERQVSLCTSLTLFIPGMTRVLFATIQNFIYRSYPTLQNTDAVNKCGRPLRRGSQLMVRGQLYGDLTNLWYNLNNLPILSSSTRINQGHDDEVSIKTNISGHYIDD